MTARAPRRSFVATLAGFAVALSGLAVVSTAAPAQAAPADHVVISEVYGAGGFAVSGNLPASTYKNDFIELYNPTNQAVSLEGWAVLYGSPTRAGGGVSNKTLLEGSIPAGGHFLVQGAGGDNGEPLPEADVTGTLNLGSQSGLIVLSNQNQNLAGVPTGSIVGTAGIVDAVGYGTANTFETQNQGTTLNGVTSANRAPVDTDTDNNNTDFTVAAPTPTNSEVPPGTVDDLVISEVYGGGGNSGATFTNDFIELYNPTATPIDVDGLSVQGRTPAPATQTAPSNANITPLEGTIPPGGYFLIQEAAGNNVTQPLPTPDVVGTMGMAAGGWQVWLAKGTTGLNPPDGHVSDPQIIDFVGAATSSKSYETAAADEAPSATRATTRGASNADTDNNKNDFTVALPDPQNSEVAAGQLAATDPGDKTATVGVPIAPIVLTATGGATPYSWSFSGLPDGITETTDGTLEGTPTTKGVATVTATVTDSATPDAASASTEFTITVGVPPYSATIAEIQGTGAASEAVGDTVTTQGVVTARYPTGTGSMAGFVIQTGGEEGVDYDTPGASDAIFVFSGNKPAPAIGETVEVKGQVSERFNSTQISVAGTADTITVLTTPQPPVVPGDVIPGTDCTIDGGCPTTAELDAMREEHEHEAFQPTGPYTVTDSYDGSPFDGGFGMQGEIGLAAESDLPLMIPTETIDQSDTAGLAAHRAYNEAHKIVLDDAKSLDYTTSANEDLRFPWITPDHPVRTGAPVTFPKPVILKYDFGVWRILPQEEVAAGEDGQDLVAIENTRTDAPEDVLGDTGDLKIATFNMLNYFNTLGEPWAASDGVPEGNPGTGYNFDNPRRCDYHRDRGTPGGPASTEVRLTNDTCEQDAKDPLTGLNVKLPGPRGAANEVSFQRQERKLLKAINTIDADVMSLEEVENSIKLYDAVIDGPDGVDKDRDDALKRLVQRLNETSSPNRWALAPSPRPQALPTVQEQDAIRSAFIYNPAKVELVGPSQVLVNAPAFRNAREPLAQAFKPVGGGRADAFIAIVNHFKSKSGPQAPATANGDNVDNGDGAGWYNGDRRRQAAALVAFAEQFAADREIESVFLTGDFNSYSAEDPVQVIEAAGYTNLKPTDGSTSYNFGGLAGSLDHVFANDAAEAMVTGEDIWEINANESVYYEYSRYNASASELYEETPFRSSDHNPEIIGIDVGELQPDPDPGPETVQLLATNDFHGRLVDDPGSAAAGAASMAGAVKQLRAQEENTIFAAAGDLVGATTFESFIQNDEPTIDALNEAGLEVSSVGNHEFDQGYHDLVDRIIPHASWEYLGANVEFKHTEDGHTAGDPALPETWCETLPNGRVVGFVGAVTEDLETLVSASAIEDVVVTDIVDTVNEHADDLKGPAGCGASGPADLVIELVHEGAATTNISAVTDDSTFGKIVAGANENVDAIVSGHTHLAYNHKVTVPEWVTEGRAVTQRPVVSAGQYGANLNRLRFEFAGTGELVNIRQTVLQLKDYDADPATQTIVDEAVAYAAVKGDEILGEIEDPFVRAQRKGDDGQIVENRGGESTLGNLVAEMQRWKTGADIGFMNPGGLRADLLGIDGDPRDVTYRQAANTQPFANTLVTMDLTGAQIKNLLEQQWQRDADNNIPSRPFLRLGTSEGFTSTFDASQPEGSRITGMWLDGTPIDPAATYKVSATSFLAGAGDNFWEFAEGTNVQDTGKTDLQAVVDYLADVAPDGGGTPLPVDYAQRQVGIDFASGAPAEYEQGDTLAFDVSSLAMTGDDDVVDTEVTLELGAATFGPFPVNNELSTDLYDYFGKAKVSITVPSVQDGTTVFTLVGNNTGTEILVPVKTSDGMVNPTVSGQDQSIGFGEGGSVPVTVDPAAATGTVTLMDGATELGSTTLSGGAGSISFGPGLAPGEHTLSLVYSGDGTYGGSQGTVKVTVGKAQATINGTPDPASVTANGGTSDITVTVDSAAAGDATGTVTASVGGTDVDSASLSGGTATLTVGPFATTGDKTVTITYSGDASTAGGTTTTTVGVTAASTSVSATGGPVTYGSSWSAAVTVTPAAATGQVEVLDGATSLGTAALSNGTASVSVSGTALQPGTHTLTVKYAGDATYAASTNSFTVVVDKRGTSVSATGGTFQVGTAWSSQVTVSPDSATGQVEIRNGATSLGTATLTNGTASIAIAGDALPVGTHTLSVTYAGDATHAASTSTVSVRITQAAPASTTVAATCPAVTVGAGWSLSAKVSPSSASGTVEVRSGATLLGSATLSGGNASVPIAGTALPVGTHTLTVSYLGSATHAASTTPCTVTVRKAKASVDGEVRPAKVVVGRKARLKVSVTAAGQVVTGKVRVTWRGQSRVATLQGGKAVVKLGTWSSAGAKKVRIAYLGSAKAERDTAVVTVHVRPKPRR